MTIQRSRLIALFLALCLGISLIPGGLFIPSARSETPVYGKVVKTETSGTIYLRKEPGGKDYWFTLPEDWVCTYHNATTSGGVDWVRVIAPHPNASNPLTARTYWGYIPAANFTLLTAEETEKYLNGGTISSVPADLPASESAGTDTTSSAPVSTAAASGTTGSITNGGTNFRTGPSKSTKSLMKLDKGTVVSVTSIPDGVGADYWYGIHYNNMDGYVNSEYLRLITGNGSSSVTVSPVTTPTPNTDGYNAVKLTKTSAHLRTAPNGEYNRDQDWEGIGSILPLAGSAVTKSNYIWYPVERNGAVYYVRSDCVSLISTSSVTPAVTAAPTATEHPTGLILGYVKTTKGGCNLRATIGGTTIKQIAKNRTLPYLSSPITQGKYTWYYVEADGNKGYLRSDVVKVVSSVPTADPDVTPEPDVTADPNATGYVKTTASDVNLRTKAGYSSMIGRVAKGVVMPYFGTPTVINGVTWYHVHHDTLGNGYIHGSYVAVVNADGSPTPTPAPTEAPTGAVITGSNSQIEASYTTLTLGSTGTAVKNLVEALKAQGFFSGAVTNKYTSTVKQAVIKFQKSKGLTADGIAGEATQHALYGTVPIGASDANNLTMTLYPAEKIDWWTGGINELWKKGANYKVYDVKTGIVWWAHRWSGGYHADVEPLTAADTARLCKAYGVTTADEIKNKNLYQRRPCLVTIGDRTFACSLYGIPHNYPEGDTISTNNFKGQCCIHFTNSWTHGSKKVDSLHTEAIQYAWEHAPNGHK